MSMKNKVLSCIVIIIVIVCLSLCTRMGIDVERDLKVLRSDSWFDDFYIKEDKVFMKCEITIQNKSNQDRYIKLFANMEEDANNGLIKSPTVSGFDKEGNDKFFVSANTTKKYKVFFVGDFAGNTVKQDRNLPVIELVVMKDIVKGKISENKSWSDVVKK